MREGEGLNGEGPSQECSLPLIPAPSWPPQPCPSSTGHTPFTAAPEEQAPAFRAFFLEAVPHPWAYLAPTQT